MYIVIMKLRFRKRIESFDGMLHQIPCLGVVEENLLQNEHDAKDTEKKESAAHHQVNFPRHVASKAEMTREGQGKVKRTTK